MYQDSVSSYNLEVSYPSLTRDQRNNAKLHLSV